jgi:hypothetical protein
MFPSQRAEVSERRAQGTGHRAEGEELRAEGQELRAEGEGRRAKSVAVPVVRDCLPSVVNLRSYGFAVLYYNLYFNGVLHLK